MPPDRLFPNLPFDSDGKEDDQQYRERSRGAERQSITLLLDLIQRLTILEQSSKFADQQRSQISEDLKTLLTNHASAAQLRDIQEQLDIVKHRVDEHQNVFAISSKVAGVIWGALSGAAVVVLSWLLERLYK